MWPDGYFQVLLIDTSIKRLKNFHDKFLSHCIMVSNAAGLINVMTMLREIINLFSVKKNYRNHIVILPFLKWINLANKNKIPACCITFLDFWQEKLKINYFCPQNNLYIQYNMLWLVGCNQMKVYRSTWLYVHVQLFELQWKLKHVAVSLIPYILKNCKFLVVIESSVY